MATEANGLGHGGLEAGHKLTGVSESAIKRGQKEIELGLDPACADRVRAPRSEMRLPLAEKYPAELATLEKIVEADIGARQTHENLVKKSDQLF
ncbi:MAG: hypothetical protein LBH62_00410 [Nitrososphaerota archaeon]|nr:hypothetical protein [Nitrososphaerota archaeon]